MLEHRRDDDATAARKFYHPASYISNSGHDYLVGHADKSQRRAEIYRAAGGEVELVVDERGKVHHSINTRSAMCQGCAVPHPVSWYDGEWHHVKEGLTAERCDCAHNGIFVCRDWHRKRHVQPQWSKSA